MRFSADRTGSSNPKFVTCAIHFDQVKPRSDGVIVVLRHAGHRSTYSILRPHLPVRLRRATRSGGFTTTARPRSAARFPDVGSIWAAPGPAPQKRDLLGGLLPTRPLGRRGDRRPQASAPHNDLLSRAAAPAAPSHWLPGPSLAGLKAVIQDSHRSACQAWGPLRKAVHRNSATGEQSVRAVPTAMRYARNRVHGSTMGAS